MSKEEDLKIIPKVSKPKLIVPFPAQLLHLHKGWEKTFTNLEVESIHSKDQKPLNLFIHQENNLHQHKST